VIKKMAAVEKQKALVVSSDREIVRSADSSGAATINVIEFENKLILASGMDGMESDRDNYAGWTPTTKKKGPSRRLSKRQRRNRARVRKL
jgi:hypothetical protein